MAIFSLLCQEQDHFSEQQELTTTTDEPLLLEPFSDDFTASLVSNEHRSFPNLNQAYLRSARKQAMQWTLSTCFRLGFGATTVLLAADHLDRCFLSSGGLSLQHDDKRRWMTQLSAVACLSLAAKVEETYVPLLLDLQTSSSSDYLFEPKTVKRMELLVLSTLQWKMNPATALSFVQCFLSKKKKKIDSVRDDPLEVLKRCEAILLSAVADWRWVRFPPSVWASAALMHANVGVFDELQPFMDMLEISKERVEECHEVVIEIMGSFGGANKRKSCYCFDEPPPSPNGVIGSTCFSYESSSSMDSPAMWPSSVSSSPEPQPPAKKLHFE